MRPIPEFQGARLTLLELDMQRRTHLPKAGSHNALTGPQRNES